MIPIASNPPESPSLLEHIQHLSIQNLTEVAHLPASSGIMIPYALTYQSIKERICAFDDYLKPKLFSEGSFVQGLRGIRILLRKELPSLKNDIEHLNDLYSDDIEILRWAIENLKTVANKISEIKAIEEIHENRFLLQGIKKVASAILHTPEKGVLSQYKKIQIAAIEIEFVPQIIEKITQCLEVLENEKEDDDTFWSLTCCGVWSDFFTTLEFPGLCQDFSIEDLRLALRTTEAFYRYVLEIVEDHKNYFNQMIINWHQIRINAEYLIDTLNQRELTSAQ